jgi:hypothetical protein
LDLRFESRVLLRLCSRMDLLERSFGQYGATIAAQTLSELRALLRLGDAEELPYLSIDSHGSRPDVSVLRDEGLAIELAPPAGPSGGREWRDWTSARVRAVSFVDMGAPSG